MKTRPLAFAAALLLASCADVYVKQTEIATGATNPSAIYIRPFDVSQARFAGHHGDTPGEKAIRRSLAPAELAEALKEEFEKMAPSIVLKDDEVPPRQGGWLVEGYFDLVHAGSPAERALAGEAGFGRSTVRIHVRIIDLEHKSAHGAKSVAKQTDTLAKSGNVIYEFDVAGGSGFTGVLGSLHAPGLGYATPFDYRNAAERIVQAITPDPHQYGSRTSTTIP
jgi:hypothetical protein